MLTTLLESTRQRRVNRSGALLSAGFHTALITAAVYATASGAAARAARSAVAVVQTVHWAQPAAAPAARPAPKPKPARKLVAPVKIPTAPPPITASEPVEASDFAPTPDAAVGGTGPRLFDASEVEVQVVAVTSTIRPEYPSSLRSSGVCALCHRPTSSLPMLSLGHCRTCDSVQPALAESRFHNWFSNSSFSGSIGSLHVVRISQLVRTSQSVRSS